MLVQTAARRFVILHHSGFGREHWDLMLEHQGVLVTWKLLKEPRAKADLPIEADRIGDHRLSYLDYEGPVSGNRGMVARVDSGAVKIEQLTTATCVFQAQGRLLSGRYELAREGESWTLRARPEPAP